MKKNEKDALLRDAAISGAAKMPYSTLKSKQCLPDAGNHGQKPQTVQRQRIFISYSRRDLASVKKLTREIEARIGERPWVDLSGIETGTQFEDVIIRAIDACQVLVFVISKNSLRSEWTKKEVLYARAKGKRILPVIIDGSALEGWFLFEFAGIDCVNYANDDQREKLMASLASAFNVSLKPATFRRRISGKYIVVAIVLVALSVVLLMLSRSSHKDKYLEGTPLTKEQADRVVEHMRQKLIDENADYIKEARAAGERAGADAKAAAERIKADVERIKREQEQQRSK